MSNDPSGEAVAVHVSSGAEIVRLHERVSADLKKSFRGKLIEDGEGKFTPDLVVRSGNQVVIIEVKTGDPALPLPSSANAQMLILKDQVRQRFGEVAAVLVTNYRVDDVDRKELDEGGIKVIDIEDSTYDSKSVFERLSGILGDADPSLLSSST